MNSMTFSDNLIDTNALLNGQRTVPSNQKNDTVPSAYFNKQVNFFKTGGKAGFSFVQQRNTHLRRSQSRDEHKMNR